MSEGPYSTDLDDGNWVIKRDHPIIATRTGELIFRCDPVKGLAAPFIDLEQAVEIANDAFQLGRAAANPVHFFHDSMLQSGSNGVS